MAKIRIDQLVADQFHISVTEAAALIMANQVLVEDTPVTQPGTQVKPDVSVRIREKKRVVALQRTDNRPKHRQRPDAIEQNRRGKAVGKGTSGCFWFVCPLVIR